MAVEITKPDQPINAGGKLSAQVLLDMRNTFEATELSIQLYGCEEINYISQVSQQPQSFTVTICEIPIQYKPIDDNRQEIGQFIYPFELTIPDWLPSSTILGSKQQSANAQIRYELRA